MFVLINICHIKNMFKNYVCIRFIFEVSSERVKKFRKTFETMKGLCYVMPVAGLMRQNTGKDGGGGDNFMY
jgi:hypothetical protein